MSEITNKLKGDVNFGKMNIAQIEHGILLKAGTTRASWGEHIKIVLISNNENNFEYQISSSPKLKTTLIDFGKNHENIKKVEAVINS